MAFVENNAFLIVERTSLLNYSRPQPKSHLHEQVCLVVKVGSEELPKVGKDIVVDKADQNGFLSRLGQRLQEILFFANAEEAVSLPKVFEVEH